MKESYYKHYHCTCYNCGYEWYEPIQEDTPREKCPSCNRDTFNVGETRYIKEGVDIIND